MSSGTNHDSFDANPPINHNQMIATLALNIVKQSKCIGDYITAHRSDASEHPYALAEVLETPEYHALRVNLKASLEDLGAFIDGPKQRLRDLCGQVYDLAAFQVAFEFDFFTLVPDQGEISFQDLAQAAKLDVDRATRIVRLIATHRFFQEHREGFIRHTPGSYALFQDQDLRSVVAYTLDENAKAAMSSSDFLKQSPFESDSTHCPFFTRHGLTAWDYYDQDPIRAQRFAKAMAGVQKVGHFISTEGFRWDDLKGTVVDVGGGSGHVSIALAQQFPNLDFVVQDDVVKMLDEGESLLAEDLKGRVKFMQQSFFKPQPCNDAAAFLLRQCTHNWCDRDVVRIFKNLVPGLENSKPGTPLLINDIILPETGVSFPLVERALRQFDMIMFVAFGAKQRTESEFRNLLRQADPRFTIRKVHSRGPQGFLEVILE